MPRIRYMLTILCLSLLIAGTTAQQVLENVYDVATGLPFQEVTGVHQDKNGYMWLEYSNQEYISRFDGITWTHFRFIDYGMPTGMSFFRETKEGLWFFKYDAVNKTTDLVLRNHQQKWRRFSFQGLNIVDYFALTDEIAYLDQDYRMYRYADTSFIYTGHTIPDSIIGRDYYLNGAQYIDKKTSLALYIYCRDQRVPYDKFVVYNYVTKSVIFTDKRDHGKRFQPMLTPNKFFFLNDIQRGYDVQNGGRAFLLKGMSKTFQDINIPFQLYRNSSTSAYISVNKKGKKDIYVFNDKENKVEKIYQDLYEGFRSSPLVKDQNNNLWYATHSGLFRRNPHILTFKESSPGMVNGLHTLAEDDQGKIWFGGYNQSGWSYWDGQSIKKPDDQNLLSNRVLPGSFYTAGKIWFFDEALDYTNISYIQRVRLKKLHFPEAVTPGYYFTKLQSGKMAAGLAGKGLLIFDPEKPSDYIIKNKDNGLLLQNVLTISEDKSHKIWMGRMSQGIACYDPKTDTVVNWLVSTENPKSLGMIASRTDHQGDLWMGTSKGLYFLHQPHRFDILSQPLFDHIVPVQLTGDYKDRVNSITETQKYLIAGSDKGVHLIDKKTPPDKEGRRQVFTLWYQEDIPGKGSEQNAILTDSKGYLWVGTNEGALRLDINSMSFDTTPTLLSLSSVKIGETEVDLSTDIIIAPKGQRSIDISWSAAGNAHFQNNVFVTILILTNNNDTIFFKTQTKDKKFILPHLAPDTYRLYIKGYKNNQLGAALEKTIIIPKLLSERMSFRVLVALLMTLIPSLFVLNISQSRRKDAEYQLKLEKAKRNQDSFRIKSLSNFFNPHFINNTLHWLQSKYRKDAETAIIIDSLASNVELLYQNMQQGLAYHSLKREIELVDNYLDIQQIRFDNMLTITQQMDRSLTIEDILFPSMLLQIHVENAVENGIRNRQGAKILNIAITHDEIYINITIEDDGRGRTLRSSSDDLRKGSTAVMNDLIEILNSYNDHKITVTYDDFIVENKYGTRVHICLPKNYNYAI